MRQTLGRLVFIDETGTTIKMTRLRGRLPQGQLLHSMSPFGRRQTQTLIAALTATGLTAPFVVDGSLYRQICDAYVETQLAPTLKRGDVVILDNLASHKSSRGE